MVERDAVNPDPDTSLRSTGPPFAPPSEGRSSSAVPVARGSDGTLVRPQDATRGVEYRCPGCGAAVVLRRGKRRRAHFAHRDESCAPDSALHRAAKAQILEVIGDWKAGLGPRPSISRPCPRFACEGGVVQDVPDDVTHAESEVRLPSGLVGDVVLYRDAEPAVVIELLVKSRVSPEKAARLRLPWVELLAADVLDRPYWWVAVQDGLRPFTCPACSREGAERVAEVERIREKATELAIQLGVELSPNPQYHPVPHVCWRCSEDIVVYAWPGSGYHSVKRPPDPIPPSVRHCVTEGAGDYWANCCPRCSAVQGDYHLGRGNPDYGVVRDILRNRSSQVPS